MVSDGDYLLPSFEAGLMDGLASGIGPLLDKVGCTLDSLGVTVSGVNKLLSEENSASIARTMVHLEKTMADLRRLASTVNGRSAELENFINNLSKMSDEFGTIVGRIDTTIAGVNDFVVTLGESELDELVKSFNELLENINDPSGTVGKLLTDDSVYNSVDSLLYDVDYLVKKIQENPKKYLRISVF